MKILLKKDSKDWDYHITFGATDVSKLPDEFIVQTNPAPVQPLGDVKCTAYSVCRIAQAEDAIDYDIDYQFSQTPHTSEGATPQDAFSVPVKIGLLPKGYVGTLQDVQAMQHKHPAYFRTDTGMFDRFDNLRSAIYLNKIPVGIASYWYSNWSLTDILPVGNREISGHMYECTGWKVVNGEVMLVIEAWTGRTLYMPRQTFNAAMQVTGSYSGTLAKVNEETIDVLKEQKLSIIKRALDGIQNILIALKQKYFLK